MTKTVPPPPSGVPAVRLAGAKRLLQALLAGAWSSAFAAGGRLSGRRLHPAAPPPGPALVVAPHPDDEVVGCGGSILRHRAAGDRVTIVWATDGSGSHALGLAPDEVAARRHREAAESARRLGVSDAVWLGLRERELAADEVSAELSARLADLLADRAPRRVYAPSRLDFHPDHRRVARAVALALARVGSEAAVSVYPVQVPLGARLANRLVDLAPVAAAHLHALRAHVSQWGTVERCLRQKRYVAAFHGLGGLAEELWELPAERYGALHLEPVPAPAVRGLRHFAATDPAAWWVGRGERLRLARRAADGRAESAR